MNVQLTTISQMKLLTVVGDEFGIELRILDVQQIEEKHIHQRSILDNLTCELRQILSPKFDTLALKWSKFHSTFSHFA